MCIRDRVEDGERLSRALNREREQENPRYEEMCRRFIADQSDFSEENILNAGIEKRFQNINLDDCEMCIRDRATDMMAKEIEEEVIELPDSKEEASTSLGALFANIKLDN